MSNIEMSPMIEMTNPSLDVIGGGIDYNYIYLIIVLIIIYIAYSIYCAKDYDDDDFIENEIEELRNMQDENLGV